MRLLVATGRSNGRVEGDVDGCVEGELVLIAQPCDATARRAGRRRLRLLACVHRPRLRRHHDDGARGRTARSPRPTYAWRCGARSRTRGRIDPDRTARRRTPSSSSARQPGAGGGGRRALRGRHRGRHGAANASSPPRWLTTTRVPPVGCRHEADARTLDRGRVARRLRPEGGGRRPDAVRLAPAEPRPARARRGPATSLAVGRRALPGLPARAPADEESVADRGAVVFPEVPGSPVDVYRAALYSPASSSTPSGTPTRSTPARTPGRGSPRRST